MTLPWSWSLSHRCFCCCCFFWLLDGARFSKLSSLQFIVIHIFCTCIIIIIPSLSPFAMLGLARSFSASAVASVGSQQQQHHHQHRSTISQTHNIIPKKPYTLLHFVAAVILFSFFCVCDCIFVRQSKSCTIHSDTHILEFMLCHIRLYVCVLARARLLVLYVCVVLRLLFYSFFIVAILLYENTMPYCAHKNKVLGELLNICFEI